MKTDAKPREYRSFPRPATRPADAYEEEPTREKIARPAASKPKNGAWQ